MLTRVQTDEGSGLALSLPQIEPAEVEFTHGQKLYFGTPDAAAAYRAAPKNYWLAPTDSPLPPPDGLRRRWVQSSSEPSEQDEFLTFPILATFPQVVST